MLQGGGITTQWQVVSTFAVTIGSTSGNDLLFPHFVNIFDLRLRNNGGMGTMSLLLISGTSEIFFFFSLLTWMTDAAVYDYKFWLGFLAMQEESNPLWFNNFLPHFGTTANTCTEVSPSTDHQDVRWQSSCAGLVQISAEFLLSLESMTVRTFFTEEGKEKNEEKKKNDHLISPHTDQSSWRSLTT